MLKDRGLLSRYKRAVAHRNVVMFTASINTFQAQDRQNSSSNRIDRHEIPLLAENLLLIDSFWEEMSQFPLRVWSLIHSPDFSECAYI